MKPFLGIDITENKDNDVLNGNDFISQKVSASNVEAFEKAVDNNLKLINKAKLPLLLRLIKGICCFAGLISVSCIVNIWDGETSLSLIYERIPWIFWICGGCLAAWGILELTARKKAKQIIQSDEGDYSRTGLDNVIKNIYTELGVPSSAPETDILTFTYKVKNNEIYAKALALVYTPYNNLIYRIFSDEENIYLANCEAKYTFPRSEIKAIKTVNKRITIPDWNKEEGPRKGRFKKFKLTVDDENCVNLKPYHILEIEHNNEVYGIYFPCYELEVFEKATGLTAETE